MMNSVMWLDEASHRVRLEPACVDDGSRNGNVATPSVRMMPMMLTDDARNASPARPLRSDTALSNAPATPIAGSNQVIGQRA